jgi:hypothetical protein
LPQEQQPRPLVVHLHLDHVEPDRRYEDPQVDAAVGGGQLLGNVDLPLADPAKPRQAHLGDDSGVQSSQTRGFDLEINVRDPRHDFAGPHETEVSGGRHYELGVGAEGVREELVLAHPGGVVLVEREVAEEVDVEGADLAPGGDPLAVDVRGEVRLLDQVRRRLDIRHEVGREGVGGLDQELVLLHCDVLPFGLSQQRDLEARGGVELAALFVGVDVPQEQLHFDLFGVLVEDRPELDLEEFQFVEGPLERAQTGDVPRELGRVGVVDRVVVVDGLVRMRPQIERPSALLSIVEDQVLLVAPPRPPILTCPHSDNPQVSATRGHSPGHSLDTCLLSSSAAALSWGVTVMLVGLTTPLDASGWTSEFRNWMRPRATTVILGDEHESSQ